MAIDNDAETGPKDPALNECAAPNEPEPVGVDPERVVVPLALTVCVPGVPALYEIEVEEEEAEEEISVVAKVETTPDELMGEEAGEDELPEEPPAAADNSANPTDPGLDRKTEYTFLRKVSPTTHEGFPLPDPPLTFDP